MKAVPHLPAEPLFRIARGRAEQITHTCHGHEVPHYEGDTARLARYLNVSKERIRRWREEDSIPLHAADACAIELNLHPAMIWPEWASIPTHQKEIP